MHLGTDQNSQHQRRHTANTNYWCCWTGADLQK